MCMSSIKKISLTGNGLLLLLAFPFISFSQLQAKLIPKKGLIINQGSLQWAMGSEINFLNENRKQHEYYFTWWEQDADTSNPQQDILFIGSSNTAVQGTFTLSRSNNKIKTELNCTWNKNTPGVCDLLYTRLWFPFFETALWSDKDGKVIQHLEKDFEDTVLIASTPFGTYRFSASNPFFIKLDTALHPGAGEFSTRSQFIRFHDRSESLLEKERIIRSFSIEQLEAPVFAKTEMPLTEKAIQLTHSTDTWVPPSGKMILLPKPTEWIPAEGFTYIPVRPKNPSDTTLTYFNEIARRYWKLDTYLNPSLNLTVDNTLSAEGYSIRIQDSIQISYASSAGLQHALETLGQLLEQKENQLVLRNGLLKDEPQISWRGIHMFTGPQSLALHKKMYQQVLQPLKINKVVLQCEQANWNSFPSIKNAISIGREDLKIEFDYLRSKHIEPIPLIQSLGHMEWFFKPLENRSLAINPSYPYTLNVNKSKGKKVMLTLWKEAIELLNPQTIHVGFDEIGMIGFNWPREKEINLFRDQLNRLNRFSKKRKLELMIWGDMGLAPGEAPDAVNGVNKQRAAQIRASIPKNTWIADWHYLSNPDPQVYKPNLQLWKKEGFRPLASPWFVPENIRGFALAANQEKAGVLQTTWADFESSEINMLKNIEQFGAYILALDYAWSGRKELPIELPYQGVTEWTNRFYRQPLPLSKKDGMSWKGLFEFQNCTRTEAIHRPNQFLLSLENPSNFGGVKLNAATALILPEATQVALLTGWKANTKIFTTPLLYGRDIRAAQDKRPIYISVMEKGGKEWYYFLTSAKELDRIEIIQTHPGAGLQITELALIQ